MRRSIQRCVNVFLTGAALTLAIGGLGPAQASNTPDQAKSDAGQAVINGTATQEQKDLVATDPRLAATVPVTYESSPVTLQRAAVRSSASTAAAAEAECPIGTKYIVTSHKYITAKSTLGFTMFKYHHTVKYCESGTRFPEFLSRSQYFTDEDWTVNVAA